MREERPLDRNTRKELYAAIYDDANWLVNLTENLLAATRLEAEKDAFKVRPELVEEVFQSAAAHLDRRAAEHRITIQLNPETMMAAMNAGLIQRVIINMVNNAIQYTPKGSHIQLRGVQEGDTVRIEVCDDGPGIPDDAKKHLFDLFYTAEQGRADCQRGFGLGLNLCQSIIAMHGGTITVLDNRPSGTIFQFRLPAARAEAREA